MASYADSCEAVLRVLLDEGPLALDDLREKCALAGAPLQKILNDLISHGQVIPVSTRVKGKKINQYSIKEIGR